MSFSLVSERAIKALRELGLTDYERQAYLALLRLGEDTAEEISKISGIP